MAAKTISAREFNQTAGDAKKAALAGPIFITDRSRPWHVLLSMEKYERLIGRKPSLRDLIAAPSTEDIDFGGVRDRSLPREVDLD
jgi:prevent-host-death family protein